MVRWVLVLAASAAGCYGLMVASAWAGERWSAESCKHLQEMKADIYAAKTDHMAWQLTPILRFQRDKCGADITAEFEALKRGARKASSSGGEAPRRPMLCDTTPKAYGGSYTDCF